MGCRVNTGPWPSEDSHSTESPEGHRLASTHNGDSKERQQQEPCDHSNGPGGRGDGGDCSHKQDRALVGTRGWHVSGGHTGDGGDGAPSLAQTEGQDLGVCSQMTVGAL